MIPADRIHDNGDGTFWWLPSDLFGPTPGVDINRLDRPCDTCGGGQEIRTGTGYTADWIPCGCIDGRHTFEIEVEVPEGRGEGFPDPGWFRTLRVHVVPDMVLPIVGRMEDDPLHGKPHICWDARHGHMLGMGHRQTPVALPPAAKPGMWAIKVRKADR